MSQVKGTEEMNASSLFPAEGLRVSRDGFDIEIRLVWYRGLPLSVVEVGDVCIDGEAIHPDQMTLLVNGKERPATELAELYEEYWYVLDSAYLHVPFRKAQKNGKYEVEVTVTLYPPYIPGIPFRNTFKRTMVAN